MGIRSDEEWAIEFLIFYELCRRYRRADIEHIYCAVQAGLAFGLKVVNVSELLWRIRPPGYHSLDRGYEPDIGAGGLAFFYWLYEINLLNQGGGDTHFYQFTRRHDKVSATVIVRTGDEPSSQIGKLEYERQFAKLQRSREAILVNSRFGTWSEFITGT
jgi:hypothetical protein